MSQGTVNRTFLLVLIKPSHYDCDGYVIRWFRNFMPSNSLATVYALAADAARRNVLGSNVNINIVPIDETNKRVRVDSVIADFRRLNCFGLVGLVGVQSNQYPRALDIARPLRAAGIPVAIGGFHVSGMVAMFKQVTPDLQEALDAGITLYCGEIEGRMDELLTAAATGSMKTIYDFGGDLPDLRRAVTPWLPRTVLRRTIGQVTSFDAGRGCPFQCSFCTIINVQGRKSRSRTADDVESIVRQNWAQGIYSFLISDDNFARNRNWESIFDRLADLRASEGIRARFMIQVDTLCHLIPGFIEKAKRAGVSRVFIGLESINPANLLSAKKRQNRVTEYRKMLMAWRAAGILTIAGYIIGFPHDTKDSVRQDIEIVKRELPVDLLEFTILTPLPGSEDHKILLERAVLLDADLNKYDTEQVCAPHSKMTRSEWEKTYDDAWKSYYAPKHLETVLRRARANGIVDYGLMAIMLWFVSTTVAVEKVHPMQGGLLRLKHPSERRPGLPIEPALQFYPNFLLETAAKQCSLVLKLLQILRIALRVVVDPGGLAYVDRAIKSADEVDAVTNGNSSQPSLSHARNTRDRGTALARSHRN
jgi:radical SAM superfamily enzyme YgiQ (UPF0313 family)